MRPIFSWKKILYAHKEMYNFHKIIFVFLLCYEVNAKGSYFFLFCSIHKVFCFRQGIPSPISDLTQRLLFEDRDPQATAQESLYELPPFDEVDILLKLYICCIGRLLLLWFFTSQNIQVDIQALAHAVELTRQGAIDSLRFARGNLSEAFQVLT